MRREAANVYLKAAGVVVCLSGWGRRCPAKPAIQETTDPKGKDAEGAAGFRYHPGENSRGNFREFHPGRESTCEPYRELIERGLACGRNALAIWQDLGSGHGFAGGYQAVKRFVRRLRG